MQTNFENINFRPVEPGVWKPVKEGDQIVGVLLRKEPRSGDISARYHIENRSGIHMLWGSTVLDDRMSYVKVGQIVKIEYKGTTSNKKGRDVHLYKIEVADTVQPQEPKKSSLEESSPLSEPAKDEEKVEGEPEELVK